MAELLEADAGLDPIVLFRRWFDEALVSGLPQPEAMTLATASADGAPSARIVLLRGFDEAGFQFFTNYQSRKGQELALNPRAALVFFWSQLGRQVRIEGEVEALSAAESDAYFRSRPYGHQLSAWASPQSQVVADRRLLEREMEALQAQFRTEVPRPVHWGGYRLRPALIEFWQGRDSRLHDRLRYRRQGDGWTRERVAP